MLMAEKQWKRLDILERVAERELGLHEAAKILRLSGRQLRRLVVAHRLKGAECVVHGNKGRPPANRTPEGVREKVLGFLRGKYVGFNDTHFTEKLGREGVKMGRSTVQRLARKAGIKAAKPRRSKRYRSRREREAQAGAMLLWDGSRHNWLEGRGPILCLMGAIDDATGELMPGAHFVKQECAAGYLRVLAAVVRDKGIPQRLYMDKHGSLKRNDEYWTLAEELEGKQRPTQVGMALEELSIEPIFALSPQAKGRVERMWGTLQDRLVSEFRLAGASTLEEANTKLEAYRQEFNQRFARPARDETSAWRKVQLGCDVSEVCSLRYDATVGNDNVVTLAGLKLQIPRPSHGRSYAKAKVQVHQLLDGTWRIKYKGQRIAELFLEGEGQELRARVRHKRSKATKAFQEAVRTFEAPQRPCARPETGSRTGAPTKPFNHWSKKQKTEAAKRSKDLRKKRPESW
jgi:transposase